MSDRQLFVVPSWLEPWWELWVPVTAALYWPAIAALLTVLALLNTAHLADRSSRVERRKARVFLLAAEMLLLEIVNQIDDYRETVARDGEDEVRADIIRIWNNDRTLDQINDWPLNEFPTVQSLQAWSLARGLAQLIYADIKERPGSIIDRVERNHKRLAEIASRIEHEAEDDRLDLHDRAGSLKSFARWMRAIWNTQLWHRPRGSSHTDTIP